MSITTKAYHSGQGDQRPVQRQVFAAVVRRLTLGSSEDINNPFPRMGAGLSSWTKCRGSCQPDRADRPRDLVLVQSMYVGEGCPCLVAANPRNVPSEWSHRCSRTHSAVSGSPFESQSPAPPGSPACWSPPTPERLLTPQTRTGELQWGLRTSPGCSPPPRLPKEILRLWTSGGRGGCPARRLHR